MNNYVNKADLKPYKELFNEAMKYIRSTVIDLEYYYRLVGSAKRNLVIEHHNKGFDLDYQIIFYKSIQPKNSSELIKIKQDFINAFNDFFVNKGYNHADDSTSAITIKNVDESKIINSYDVVILSPESNGLFIFKYQDEAKTQMCLNQVKNSLEFQKNYKKIKGAENWSILRNIYIKKRKTITQNKRSHLVY